MLIRRQGRDDVFDRPHAATAAGLPVGLGEAVDRPKHGQVAIFQNIARVHFDSSLSASTKTRKRHEALVRVSLWISFYADVGATAFARSRAAWKPGRARSIISSLAVNEIRK